MSAPAGEPAANTEPQQPDAPTDPPQPAAPPQPAQEAERDADQQSENNDDLPEWAREKLKKANAEAARYRTQLREAEPLIQAAKEAEEAQKTELQRAQEARDSALGELETLRGQNETLRLATKYGIPEEHHRFIVGATPEEREDAAVAIAQMVTAAKADPGGPPSNRTRENLRPGASPDEPTTPDDSYPSNWLPKSARRA